MFNIELLIEQLKSWSRGYIPASAQITMDEAAHIIAAQNKEIQELKQEIERLKIIPVTEPEPIKANPAKAAPKKRTKKAVSK